MRLTYRQSLLVTAASATAAALGFVWLVIARDVGDAAIHPSLAVVLAAGLASLVAYVMASTLAARRAARAAAIVDVARRYALGDLSRPGQDYGDDDLGISVRAMDAAVLELGRRMAALARDRARSEAILASMVEGVLVVDDTGRLQLANEAARSMLQITSDAIGRPYLEVVRHPAIVERLGQALAGQVSDGVEVALAREGARDLIARSAPVVATGKGAVLVLHDVTELKRAGQVRRDFVANVSHELRTPLTAIRGYAEALLDDAGDTALRERFLGIIQRHAARMERLVTELLRLARLDAGQESLDIAPTDIAHLVEGIVDDLSAPIAEKRLHVEVAPSPGLTPALVDPAKVHDIARNLVENAVTYTQAGGRIDIAVAVADGVLALRVADNGPGIPPEDLGRVFERFYRVDKSRSRPGGTGLGLAIVRHLAELHGGGVTVTNRPEGGAQFDVRLALQKPAGG